MQSAAAITDIQHGLEAQQNALEGIQRGLAPIGNLKADMLEVMNQNWRFYVTSGLVHPSLPIARQSLFQAIMHPRPFKMSAQESREGG